MKNKKMILSLVGAILEVVGGIGSIIEIFAEVMPNDKVEPNDNEINKKLECNKTEVQ